MSGIFTHAGIGIAELGVWFPAMTGAAKDYQDRATIRRILGEIRADAAGSFIYTFPLAGDALVAALARVVAALVGVTVLREVALVVFPLVATGILLSTNDLPFSVETVAVIFLAAIASRAWDAFVVVIAAIVIAAVIIGWRRIVVACRNRIVIEGRNIARRIIIEGVVSARRVVVALLADRSRPRLLLLARRFPAPAARNADTHNRRSGEGEQSEPRRPGFRFSAFPRFNSVHDFPPLAGLLMIVSKGGETRKEFIPQPRFLNKKAYLGG
jgi:hypothetical protein